jgi:DNA processing protein
MVTQVALKQQIDTCHIYSLLKVPGIGKKMVQQILKVLPFSPTSSRDLHDVLVEVHRSHPNIKIPSISDLEAGLKDFNRLAEDSDRAQIQIVGISDPTFPEALKRIDDPPLILYGRGDLSCLRPEESIAVIGTRNPTEVGRKTGHWLARRLAQSGLIIVSGLAEGCDTVAHEGCLAANGRTVAVLAHGLQMIYPAKNRKLAEQIVEMGGCLVSEYPLGQKPFKNAFVERDRLQSALSAAVVVIQTDIKGGTMHTVRFCLEQKRKLACLEFPSDKRSDQSRGNEMLIAKGKATPIRERKDSDAFIRSVYGEQFVPSAPLSPVEVSQPIELAFEESKTQRHELLDSPTFQKPFPLVVSTRLEPAEQEQFIKMCKASGKTPEVVVTELIQQYLNSSLSSIEVPTLGFNNEQLVLVLNHGYSDTSELPQAVMSEQPVETYLTQKQLAARLGVSTDTIRKRKSKSDFPIWSQEKDPQKLSWEFVSETKNFQSF